MRTLVGILGSPSRTRAEAAAAAAQVRRLVPGVVLVMLGMIGVFLVGWTWAQPSRH